MPNSSNISMGFRGMVQDLHQLSTEANSYSFALNTVIEDFSYGNSLLLQNEQSNKCSVEFPIGYRVVGFVEITEQNRTIFFLKNPTTGRSQIGEVLNCNAKESVDKIRESNCRTCPTDYYSEEETPLEKQTENCYCQYKILVNDCVTTTGCLNFDLNYRVDIEYKITNCSLNLYFTDNINERRFVYFDYTDNDTTKGLVLQSRFKKITGYTSGSCPQPIYDDCLDCEKIKFHPDYSIPCIEFIDFVNGGNLKAGVYQVLVAYADVYGNPISNYFPASQTVPLFEKQITFETNYITNKALQFKVYNLKNDSIFQYYNVVIAQTIEQFTEFIHVGTFSTTQTEYVYTGYEQTLKRLNPTEVFFKRPFYKLAKGVTKANNYLFFTGVTEYPILNLQPVANSVKLKWQTVAVKEGAYSDPRNTFYYRTYQRDEVYSFGIVFEMNNGRETCAFHIPGRAPNANDIASVCIPNNDVFIEKSCEQTQPCNGVVTSITTEFGGAPTTTTCRPKWQVYNTASVTASPNQYSEYCNDDKCWQYGDFAYWESTEKYPNVPEVWGDLCGTCIRHHKFPDSAVSHIHDGKDAIKQYKENNYIFPIGVQIDHQSVITALDGAVLSGLITPQQRSEIKSYRIVRGNRVGNKSIQAKGLLFNMFEYTKYGTKYYFPNYPYNDLSEDDYLDGVSLSAAERFTFHSPDTHFVNASIGNILKIETEEIGQSEGYYTYSNCQAKHRFLSIFAQTLAFGLGLAAAISATGEKECRTVTYQDPTTTEKTLVYPNISGTSTVLWTPVSATATNTITTTQGTYNTTDTETHNTRTPIKVENCKIVQDTGSGAEKIAKEERTICKGDTWQVFECPTFLNGIFIGAADIMQRTILGILEMDKILQTIRAIIPNINYSIQYNSVGKYNSYRLPTLGNIVREIEKSAYLTPNIQSVDEPSDNPLATFETVKINNWNRESSVYLKIKNIIANPVTPDNSKVAMRNSPYRHGELDRLFNRTISSYYASVKNNILNQYGQLCNIDYLETSGCSFTLSGTYTECTAKVFGGDTYINRFALKRKMPFFTHTMCNLPDGSDVLYSELGNAGTPRYYFNTPQPLLERVSGNGESGILGALVGVATIIPNILLSIVNPNVLSLVNDNRHNYDVDSPGLFHQNGYVNLFNYGIPYFLVESDINVDYRYAENKTDKDFYPHNTDLKTWLEEENVPIAVDNNYYYNRTYSKQHKENTICRSCILDIADLKCQSTNYNRIIYSETSETENKNDNWLIFKANNYYDFPLSLGKLVTADGIENDKVLARLEKGTQIFNAYNTIVGTEENIQVGTGGIFATRPRDIAITDLGYAGTQHRDILHTEFGHVWADSERGQVFNLATGGQGIDEISKEGMKSWFKENLPFFIKKDFPEYEFIDNNLNGVGLHYCFDKRFNRLLITKLDYKTLDPAVKYNKAGNYFYIQNGTLQTRVELWNPKYFCNKGWTISYNFYTKTWVSFHSYIPLLYIEHIDVFDSLSSGKTVVNNQLVDRQKLYTHNVTNKSYQVFYGKLHPFIIEYQSKQDVGNHTLHSVDYYVDVIRYHNEFDTYYNRYKTFNKAIIYNESQTSGLLHFKISNHEDLTQILNYPKRVSDGYEILTSNSENMWRFNDFWDATIRQDNNMPIFNYECNNVNKQLNTKILNYDKPDFNRARIRQRMCKIRLIQDVESNYKYIFHFALNKQHQSFR